MPGLVLGRIAQAPADVFASGNVGHAISEVRLVGRTGAGHNAGMADGYRVTEAMDGTFHVELWSSKGGRERLIYKTRGFQTREMAEAWIVPAEELVMALFPPVSRGFISSREAHDVPILGINLISPNSPPPHASLPAPLGS